MNAPINIDSLTPKRMRIEQLEYEYRQELIAFNAKRERIISDMLSISPVKEEDKFKWY